MKKIFIISRAKNESDIIESFCRYNLLYCDGMIINDNKSDDNTLEILLKLMNEGLPIHLTQEASQMKKASMAIDEYGADLVIPLDADEFLYQIDGINPRDALEELKEDIEYQAIWRTYVYENEPDIKLGFMPNNFSNYRNSRMENPDIYTRHKKTITSKYLIKEIQAKYVSGAHFLEYPEEYKDSIKTEIHQKLVFAHFPIRSKNQVMKKGVLNWINRNSVENCMPRYMLDAFQLGILFNEIKLSGELSNKKMKQYSVEYAMQLDSNTKNEIRITNREELDKLKKELGNNILINSKMDIKYCNEKLKLHYTDYSVNNKLFLRSLLNEIDKTITILSSRVADKTNDLNNYISSIKRNCTIFFDTGNGFNSNEVQNFSFIGNNVEISCQLPDNTLKVRLDPVEGFGCVIKNLEILSYDGIVKYKPLNGFMDNKKNIVFTNMDPIIELNGAYLWIKIKYQILLLSEYSHFDFLENYVTTCKIYGNVVNERDDLIIERNNVINERDNLIIECNNVINERDNLIIERNNVINERDNLIIERNNVINERDNLINEHNNIYNSKSWRITKPLRKIGSFIRKNNILYLPIKTLISIKRKGKINNILNKNKDIFSKYMQKDNIKICIQIHIYHLDLLNEIIKNIKKIPFQYHCYITTDTDEKVAVIKNKFTKSCKNINKIYFEKYENCGRDVAPFIEQIRKNINNYEYILHIHTKKSIGNLHFGNEWRKYLYKYLLGNKKNIKYIFYKFLTNNRLGITYPTYPPVKPYMIWSGGNAEQGKKNVHDLLTKIGVEIFLDEKPEFPAGNMFWARTKSIQKIFNSDIKQSDFPNEDNQQDMTLAHAIERSWVYIAKYEGYTYEEIKD